jgi:hypothetical protein
MARAGSRLLVGLGLLPFVLGAAPDASTVTIPEGCDGPLSPSQLIPGMATGQLVTSGGSVTLRFASRVYACSEWPTGITSSCEEQWSYTVTVPASALQPGTYRLSELSAQFGELYSTVGPPVSHGTQAGCSRSQAPCSTAVDGVGTIALTDPGATLTIAAASDACVTGEIHGLADPVFPNAPVHDGAFFAVRCP